MGTKEEYDEDIRLVPPGPPCSPEESIQRVTEVLNHTAQKRFIWVVAQENSVPTVPDNPNRIYSRYVNVKQCNIDGQKMKGDVFRVWILNDWNVKVNQIIPVTPMADGTYISTGSSSQPATPAYVEVVTEMRYNTVNHKFECRSVRIVGAMLGLSGWKSWHSAEEITPVNGVQYASSAYQQRFRNNVYVLENGDNSAYGSWMTTTDCP